MSKNTEEYINELRNRISYLEKEQRHHIEEIASLRHKLKTSEEFLKEHSIEMKNMIDNVQKFNNILSKLLTL